MGLRSSLDLLRAAYFASRISRRSFHHARLLRHTEQERLTDNFQIL